MRKLVVRTAAAALLAVVTLVAVGGRADAAEPSRASTARRSPRTARSRRRWRRTAPTRWWCGRRRSGGPPGDPRPPVSKDGALLGSEIAIAARNGARTRRRSPPGRTASSSSRGRTTATTLTTARRHLREAGISANGTCSTGRDPDEQRLDRPRRRRPRPGHRVEREHLPRRLHRPTTWLRNISGIFGGRVSLVRSSTATSGSSVAGRSGCGGDNFDARAHGGAAGGVLRGRVGRGAPQRERSSIQGVRFNGSSVAARHTFRVSSARRPTEPRPSRSTGVPRRLERSTPGEGRALGSRVDPNGAVRTSSGSCW